MADSGGSGVGRGRGRASLMMQFLSAKESQSAERETPLERISTAADDDDAIETEVPKPRGRGALFQRFSRAGSDSVASATPGSDDTVSEKSLPITTSEVESESETASCSSFSSSQKLKPRGRAALLGFQQPKSTDVSEKMKEMTIKERSPESDKSSGDKRVEFVKQPPVMKHGMNGRKVEATANRIRLDLLDKNRGIYEYELSFTPDVDSTRERIYIVNQNLKAAGGTVKIFDGGWRLFSPVKFCDDVFTGNSTLRSGLEVEIKFTFKRVKPFDDCKQVLNIIFKRIMGELQLVKFGRSDYNPKAAHLIPEFKLSVWPGCITAVDEFEGGIQLSCDASHRVLRGETCYEIITEIIRKHSAGSTRSIDQTLKTDIINTFVGESVLTKYNNRLYKIDDVIFDITPLSTFDRNGVPTTYVDYFKVQYNLDIKDKKQPIFVHRLRRKERGKENEEQLVHLIPELCTPTGLTESMRSNFRLMKSVADFTRIAPLQRQTALREFIRGIKGNEKAHAHLRDWGLQLPDTTIDMTARILDPELIIFGKNVTVQEPTADWGRAASNNCVLSPIDINDWVILHVQRDYRCVQTFCEIMRELSRKVGIRVNKPEVIAVQGEGARFYTDQIRALSRKAEYQIIVMIFPSNRDDRYSAVKRLCNSELGIASQVINSKTLSNPKSIKSIVTKIILQINCKIGGALWGVQIPLQQEGIMFCGIDTYHDAVHKQRSVVALVTSINTTCTRFTSCTAMHNVGQEISDVITSLLKECLQQWNNVNNAFPSRIVMYRDGVGDGQLKVVRDFEVPQFYRLFPFVSPNYKPKLTYVVVQKRINTRIYLPVRGGFNNPPPGTVIDHTITRRDWFDYYLVSQNVRQGTVSPTHYVVVHDSSGMSVDQIQKLSYKMTHVYYNWNGTVRVPAPCQYAHKLAYLVGQHMHDAAKANLRNTLFFL